MSNASDAPSTPSLYGQEPGPVVTTTPLALGELLQLLVTSPTQLFRRLGEQPQWLMPMLLMMGTGLLLSALWLWKMDPLASVQASMDVTSQWMSQFGKPLPDEVVQAALDNAKRPVVGHLAGALLAPWCLYCILALLLWVAARMGRMTEDQPPTFKQALSVATAQALPMALTQVLTALLILLKPVGGLTVMGLNPLTVGYFLVPSNPFVRGLTVGLLDPMYLLSWVLLVLGLKYTLRAKTWAVVLVSVLLALVAIPVRVFGGMY